MCYMNCKYENHKGECTHSIDKPADGECQIDSQDSLDEDFDEDQTSGIIFLSGGKIATMIMYKT